MSNPTGGAAALRHIAINCDNVERGKRFYESVFGWRLNPWGPPGFFMGSDSRGTFTALQSRREIEPGVRMNGPECTFAIADIDAAETAILAAGGRIVMPKVTIPGVGTLLFFSDTEGNVAGAMQYEKSSLPPG